MEMIESQSVELEKEVATAKKTAFKRAVHERLDKAGVPPFADQECRVGARLDWLCGQLVTVAKMAELGYLTGHMERCGEHILVTVQLSERQVEQFNAALATYEAMRGGNKCGG